MGGGSRGKETRRAEDLEVEDQTIQRLREGSAYSASFRDVTCEFAGGVLRLSGSVSSFYMKQQLQALAMRIEGIEQVENCVKVLSSDDLTRRRPK